MPAKRIHVYYSGRVQGVGFRFTAQAIAANLGLTGWVKNLPDGKVELVCEGEKEKLDKILSKIDAEFSNYIRRKDIDWASASGEFTNFEIRFF
jgi:acylphosphatase